LRATNSNGKFERKLAVEGPVEVDVQTAAGNISVRMVTGSTVRVSGEVRVKTGLLQSDSVSERKLQQIISHPPIQQHGNSITIGRVRDSDLRRDTFISYEIEVPADTRLRSNTGLGDLQVEGLRGPVTADTGAGKVTISGVTGEVHANTGLGDVLINRVSGTLRADSAAGNVSAEGEPGGAWRLTTVLGDVRVHLLGETGLDLHAETGLGEILTKFPLKVEGAVSHELRGKVRGGGLLIELKSSAGNIHIE
jgi:DUF4097 and DUF4098 domain-containing protein YvlB